MCSIETYAIMNPTGNNDESSGGGRSLPPDSTEYELVSLGLTLNFFEIWLQSFKKNYLHPKTCIVRK